VALSTPDEGCEPGKPPACKRMVSTPSGNVSVGASPANERRPFRRLDGDPSGVRRRRTRHRNTYMGV